MAEKKLLVDTEFESHNGGVKYTGELRKRIEDLAILVMDSVEQSPYQAAEVLGSLVRITAQALFRENRVPQKEEEKEDFFRELERRVDARIQEIRNLQSA